MNIWEALHVDSHIWHDRKVSYPKRWRDVGKLDFEERTTTYPGGFLQRLMIVSCGNDAMRILSPLVETSDLASESGDMLDVLSSVSVLLLLVPSIESIVSTAHSAKVDFGFRLIPNFNSDSKYFGLNGIA